MMDFPGFNYKNPEEIFNEYRQLTKNMDIDITGLSYRRLKGKKLSMACIIRNT
jgi:ferredoxin-nitrate reductase